MDQQEDGHGGSGSRREQVWARQQGPSSRPQHLPEPEATPLLGLRHLFKIPSLGGEHPMGRVPSLGCSSGDGEGFDPSEVDWEPDLHLFM